jgi:MFS family permease
VIPPAARTEFAAALLQTAITAALALLCVFLYRRHGKPYFAWFAAAWGLYVVRLLAIGSFLATGVRGWLYVHQVVTGLTALALLWAALVFSRQLAWRGAYLLVALFPAVWSYVAIYRLDRFALAAGPMVAFLSLATGWAGVAFWRYHRQVGSPGALLLGAALGLWALHHLDYPFLRARGAWSPWGYYLDIAFALAVGLGIMLLVMDDLRRGLGALSALSGDLQRAPQLGDPAGPAAQPPAVAAGRARDGVLRPRRRRGGVHLRARRRHLRGVDGGAAGRRTRRPARAGAGDGQPRGGAGRGRARVGGGAAGVGRRRGGRRRDR